MISNPQMSNSSVRRARPWVVTLCGMEVLTFCGSLVLGAWSLAEGPWDPLGLGEGVRGVEGSRGLGEGHCWWASGATASFRVR